MICCYRQPAELRLLIFIYLVMVFITGCSSSDKSPENPVQFPAATQDLTPRELTEAYCGACHLYPEPELLPGPVWDNTVLKNMGSRLGIETEGYDPFRRLTMYDNYVLRQSNIYPEQSLISPGDWETIVDYYLSHAPDSQASQGTKKEIILGLNGFRIKAIDHLPSQPLSTTIAVGSEGKIHWGSRLGDLMTIAGDGQISTRLLESAPSQLVSVENVHYVITMGVMDPSEESKGRLYRIQGRKVDTLLNKLQRPVHLSIIDLDNDGADDFIISQFGNQTGKLSWFRSLPEDQYEEVIIKNAAGAVKTEVRDFNNDGRPDIMALFGQGDERLSIFYLENNHKFSEEVLLRFPPVFGSSGFELVDFNLDGEPDILYTNGDNADYTYSLKPYHGTRIYLNQGSNQYKQAYFYPLYGATKSMAGDFDKDGDVDMFTVCFFPDFENEFPEGFVYFENQGNLEFTPYSFPESVYGRWLVADTGDVDGDGDEDIVLGSFLHLIKVAPRGLIDKWMEKGYQMVVLENTHEGRD